jgi:hypothetical protein
MLEIWPLASITRNPAAQHCVRVGHPGCRAVASVS